MKPIELKVARIGNSRGVRIPAGTLERYHVGATVVMEERTDGILLRPVGRRDAKLTWEDTAREMAVEAEDWTAWDSVSGDGLEEVPWEAVRPRRVAETKSNYNPAKRRTKP